MVVENGNQIVGGWEMTADDHFPIPAPLVRRIRGAAKREHSMPAHSDVVSQSGNPNITKKAKDSGYYRYNTRE